MVGGLIAAACNTDKATPTPGPLDYRTPPPAGPTKPGSTGATASPTALSAADQIDADHKKAVTDFLQNQQTPLTKGKGGQVVAPTIDTA